jgi:hypothetical protein
MSSGPSLGYGIQRLMDAQMRYMRAGPPVYLRLRNFASIEDQTWAQLGFAVSPSGTEEVGTTDILIRPQPAVMMVSVHNIGMSTGKLRFGARTFLISATFVDRQVRSQALTNQDLVWRAPEVVGLVIGDQLFSIEDISHEELGGKTISWLLTCNASEIK